MRKPRMSGGTQTSARGPVAERGMLVSDGESHFSLFSSFTKPPRLLYHYTSMEGLLGIGRSARFTLLTLVISTTVLIPRMYLTSWRIILLSESAEGQIMIKNTTRNCRLP